MQIQHHFDRPLLQGINNLILDEIYLRVVLFRWIFPPPIEISSNKRAPVVPMDHSIRINHRKYLENKVVPECLRDFFVGSEEDDEVMHDPTGDRLACVGAGQQDNDWKVRLVSFDFLEVCDGEHLQAVADQGCACEFAMEVCVLTLVYRVQ